MKIASIVLTAFLLTSQGLVFAQPSNIASNKDNTLHEDVNGLLSNGGHSTIWAGKANNGTIKRGVLQFDIDAIVPSGSTITSASLVMRLTGGKGASAETINIHTLSGDWGEGTVVATSGGGNGGTAMTGDVTWKHQFFNTQNWTSLGGDYNGSASASQSMSNSVQTVTWTSAQMVTDAQNWLDNPSTNFGYILIGSESTAGVTRKFGSKENGTPSNRPVLTLNYTLPPTTSVDIDPSDSTVCNGNDVSFGIKATGATTYQWQENTGSWANMTDGGAVSGATTATVTISPATTGMSGNEYRCLVTGSNNDTSLVATLTVNASPSVAITPGDTVVCNETSVLLTASSGGSSQWYLNGATISGATTATYTATATGHYNMIKTNMNTCSDSSATGSFVEFSTCAGIRESAINEVKLFPNPSNGLVSLSVAHHDNLNYSVMDMHGKVIIQGIIALGTNRVNLDLSNQPSGIYYLKLSGEGTSSSHKIILQ